jgi:hypothetical protein
MTSKFNEAIRNAYRIFLEQEAPVDEQNPPDAANNSGEEPSPEEDTSKKVADTIDAASLSMKEMFVDFVSMLLQEKLAGKLKVDSPELNTLLDGIKGAFNKDNPLQSLDAIQELIKAANTRYKPVV